MQRTHSSTAARACAPAAAGGPICPDGRTSMPRVVKRNRPSNSARCCGLDCKAASCPLPALPPPAPLPPDATPLLPPPVSPPTAPAKPWMDRSPPWMTTDWPSGSCTGAWGLSPGVGSGGLSPGVGLPSRGLLGSGGDGGAAGTGTGVGAAGEGLGDGHGVALTAGQGRTMAALLEFSTVAFEPCSAACTDELSE